MRHLDREDGGSGLRGIAATLLLAGLLGLAAGARAQPETPRAGLVIQPPEGPVLTYCVELGAEEISGLELLAASGLELAQRSTLLGSMVCRIGQTGCDYPAEPCWCHCQSLGGDCRYWAYQTRGEEGWDYSLVGPSARRVRHGDVDGWAWGPGSVVAGAQPPPLRFEEICAAKPAAPATRDPSPDPGATVRPGRGPDPTVSPAPVASRRARPTATRAGDPTGPATGSPLAGARASAPAEAGASADGARPSAAAPTGRSSEGRADGAMDGPTPGAGEEPGSTPTPAGSGRAGVSRDGSAEGGSAAAAGPAPRAGTPGEVARGDADARDPAPAEAGGLDARSLAGYLLFGLIVLGLAGLALSGRRG